MPLDGHSYLVSQGWSGKGSGLRTGAISRPLAIPQKKTLAGLGKDRDDAFPFWDHLFTVAAKTIQVKIHKDEDDSNNTDSDTSTIIPALTRTSTGILSNKRPLVGTPASSGASTPGAEASSSSSGSHMTIMARAKRDAARKGLYSRFFRGPVLGPDDDVPETKVASTSIVVEAVATIRDVSITVEQEDAVVTDEDDRINERREKKEKRRKEKEILKEEKRAKKAKKTELKERKRKGKWKEGEEIQTEGPVEGDMDAVDNGTESKASKKRKRMAYREAISEDVSLPEERKERKKKKKERSSGVKDKTRLEDAALGSKTKEERQQRKEEKKERRRQKEAKALST